MQNELEVFEKKLEYRPEDAGYDSTKIPVIDNHLTELINGKRLVAGGYVISRNGRVIACRSMGKLRPASSDSPFLPDSIRRIASATKMFTAAAIMQLVERGRIWIHQPVMEIINEFDNPTHKGITIFHLLTHTSGLRPDPDSFFEPYPEYKNSYEDNWIKSALAGSATIEPGKEWRYCSAGFSVLSEIVERISGIKYEKYLMDNIIKPLEMKDTFFDLPEELAERVCLTSEREEKWFADRNNRPASAPPRGAGGLYSTMEDMQKFGQMMINKGTLNGVRVLSRKTVECMAKNHLNGIKSYCWGSGGIEMEYGLGFHVYSNNTFLSPGSFCHEGAGVCGMYMDPVENFVFTYMCPLAQGVPWEVKAVINFRNVVWSGIL